MFVARKKDASIFYTHIGATADVAQLISHDSPNKLTKELENKVFEVEIQREDLKYFQDNYRVSNLCHNDNSIIVRIVTDNPPTDCQFTTAKPTLEDLYLYIFEQGM